MTNHQKIFHTMQGEHCPGPFFLSLVEAEAGAHLQPQPQPSSRLLPVRVTFPAPYLDIIPPLEKGFWKELKTCTHHRV